MEVEIKDTGKTQIHSSQDTYEIIRKIFFDRHEKVETRKEHFWTIALNTVLKILCIELISMGSNTETIAAPQEIFRLPLYKSADKVILIHNHPNDSLKPSDADLNVTSRLIQAGLLFDIKVIDHVIVSEHCYFSFCDNGLIEKLRWDRKYALTFIHEKQVTKEIEKIKADAKKQEKAFGREQEKLGRERGNIEGRAEGVKTERESIAKNLLGQGLDISEVERATGLTKQWIGRLKNGLMKERRKKEVNMVDITH